MTEPQQPTDAPGPLVEAVDVHKSLGGREILKGINLKVFPGQTLVVLGGSGCGKTTVLNHLIGKYRPDTGAVRLYGRDLADLSTAELDQLRTAEGYGIGMLFQTGALFGSMTVGMNVAVPIIEHRRVAESIVRIWVTMKLRLVGMARFEHQLPSTLSGGQRKRAGLARAIALDPKIIFYDEPSSGLDPISTTIIDGLIVGITKKLGAASVVVSHDLASAFRIADQIVMLDAGQVIASGTPEDIKSNADPRVQQFIQGAPEGPMTPDESDQDFWHTLAQSQFSLR